MDWFLATAIGHTERLEELILDGADLNQQNWDGKTALHISCYYGYYSMVKLLLRYGARSEILSLSGLTPKDLARKREIIVLFDIYEGKLTKPARNR